MQPSQYLQDGIDFDEKVPFLPAFAPLVFADQLP